MALVSSTAAGAMAISMFKAFLFVVLAKCVLSTFYVEDGDLDKPFYPTPIVDIINNDSDAGWTAGVNEPFINYTLRDLRHMGSVAFSQSVTEIPLKETLTEKLEAAFKQPPPSFDAREKWNCPSMRRILFQGTCASCWAYSAVQVLQDRLCISFGLDKELSVNNLLACCSNCGNCRAGSLISTYIYLADVGTVSNACDPYFDTSVCDTVGCKAEDTPKCRGSCVNGEKWSKRYRTTSRGYKVRGIEAIMNEIMTKGPVSATLSAFEDLITYKSGVYRHREGKFIINHVVKLIGWGVTDQGERYWIATNQWTSNWGENGNFKIRLGVNECGIETGVITADPMDPRDGIASVI